MAGLPWYEIPLDGEIEAYENIFSTGYWEWDEESGTADSDSWDEEFDYEVDTRFSVASPDDEEEGVGYDQCGPMPLDEEDAKHMEVVQALDSMLPPNIPARMKEVLNSVKHHVFGRYNINRIEGSLLTISPLGWLKLEAETHGTLVLPDDERDALHLARIQKALIEVFGWAVTHGVYDDRRLISEVYDILSPLSEQDIHDWNRRSNGASGIIRTDIVYDFGNDDDWPNDGFSIKAANRALRPFDMDFRTV